MLECAIIIKNLGSRIMMKRIFKSVCLCVCILSLSVTSYANTNKEVNSDKVIPDIEIYVNYNIDPEVMEILRIADEFLETNKNLSIEQLDTYVKEEIKSKKSLNFKYPKDTIVPFVDYAGLLPISEDKLNKYEKELFNKNPINGALALADASVAITRTSKLWEDDYGFHNDNTDAFRHSYWNGLMTYHTSKSFAKSFADAHEKGTPNPPLESEMDYYNNEKGRDTVDNTSYPNFSNAMMAPAAIEEDIMDAIKDGEMKRYEGTDIGTKTYLVKTNAVGLK